MKRRASTFLFLLILVFILISTSCEDIIKPQPEPPDTTIPKVISVTPQNGTTGITVAPSKIQIKAVLSEPVVVEKEDVILKFATYSSTTTIIQDGKSVPVNIYSYDTLKTNVDSDENELVINFDDSLQYDTKHVIILDSTITDVAGNNLSRYKWSFITEKNPHS